MLNNTGPKIVNLKGTAHHSSTVHGYVTSLKSGTGNKIVRCMKPELLTKGGKSWAMGGRYWIIIFILILCTSLSFSKLYLQNLITRSTNKMLTSSQASCTEEWREWRLVVNYWLYLMVERSFVFSCCYKLITGRSKLLREVWQFS